MTKPKAKPKAKPSVEKAEPKKPTVPLKEWDHRSEYPLGEIGIGDEVESMHHGIGVMSNHIGGMFPLQITFTGGRLMSYSKTGKYFPDDSEFAEKNPILKITKKMPPMAKEE